MTTTDVQKKTIDLFGSDLGADLLNNKAIVPVRADKQPAAGIRDYNNGVDLNQPFGPYEGLAIINGRLSGIVAVDLDRHDLIPPVDFNVKTNKGGHIYIPWQGERRKSNFAPGVDVLGAGGYSIFTGPGKDFVSPVLADPAAVTDWLSSLSTSPLKRVGTEDKDRGSSQSVVTDSENRECVYKAKLDALGYPLRIDTITKTYVSQMRNTQEGARNTMCHRYALEMYRCGGDLDAFEEAAIQSGLDPREVRATISQARADIDFDYRPETEIYERTQGWLYAHAEVFKGVMLDIANELAFEAIVTNSSRPLVSQTRTAVNVGSDRPYVGRVIKIMQDRYKAVRIHPNSGTWGNGWTHCNNYELTINGETI